MVPVLLLSVAAARCLARRVRRAMCDAPEDDTHMAMSHQVEPVRMTRTPRRAALRAIPVQYLIDAVPPMYQISDLSDQAPDHPPHPPHPPPTTLRPTLPTKPATLPSLCCVRLTQPQPQPRDVMTVGFMVWNVQEDVPASKQMRNMQMFSGLENEEEDALLLELDGVVPPDHARPHLGVDRDVRGDANASRMFRDGFAVRPVGVRTRIACPCSEPPTGPTDRTSCPRCTHAIVTSSRSDCNHRPCPLRSLGGYMQTPTRTPTGTPAGTRSRLRASEQLARVSTDWHDSSTPPSTKRRYVQPPQGYPSSWSGGHEHATPPRLSQSARPPARGDGAAQRSPTRGGSWTDGPRGGSHVSPPAGANSRERPPSRGPVAPTASNTARARPPSRGPPASAHRPGPSSSARVSAAGERRLRPLSSLGLDPSKAAHMVAVDYSSSSDDGSRSPTPTTML